MDYYYSDGKETFGPYSMDELRTRGLPPETLVWHEKMDKWAYWKDVISLDTLPAKIIPPPLPIRDKSKSTDRRDDILKPAHVRTVYLKDEEIIISRRVLRVMLGWIIFHMVAIFTSYREITFFNVSGEPRPQHFWPFVNFIDEYYVKSENMVAAVSETRRKFNGIFVNYDWTEFGTYVGGVLLLLLFYYLYKRAD